MRIVQLTPGTGNFHCGGCLRDEALIKALRQRNHDAVMLPLYLPTVLDSDHRNDDSTAPSGSAAEVPVFFGGVNVYLQQKSGLFRHTPRWFDRFWDNRWLLKKAAARSGMTRARDLGEMTVSMLQGRHGRQVKELDRLLDWLENQGKPDVVCISNALLLGMAGSIQDRLGVPVVGTLQGEDGFLDSLPEPWRQDAWALVAESARKTDALIAVSPYYGKIMSDRLGLSLDAIDVVQNGIDASDMPAERRHEQTGLTLGYLARLCEVKGLRMLVEAFIRLKQRPELNDLRLLAVGAATASDEPLIDELKQRLADAGHEDDVEFRRNVGRAEKIAALREMSVLSVPAEYGEAFGLYVVEAMACGVPVVQPDHAAFPDLISATGGGILYRCGDVASLTDQLDGLLRDAERRTALGTAGARSVRERFSHHNMAEGIERVLQRTIATAKNRGKTDSTTKSARSNALSLAEGVA